MPIACTSPPSPAAARLLAEIALERMAAGHADDARRAAEDAFDLLGSIPDRTASADVSLVLGEALLALHEAHRARAAFEEAMSTFDETGELARAAKAREGFARALLMMGDPAGRAVLEDAGEIYDELGDERAALAIDRQLRVIQAELEESPRSFSATWRVSPRLA